MIKTTKHKIVSFRPVTDPNLALEAYSEQNKTLAAYGLDFISLPKEWMNNPDVYCYVFVNDQNKPICGLRIQIKNKQKMPLELALENQSKLLAKFIESKSKEGVVCELCGLWVSAGYRKQNLPQKLTALAIKEAPKLGIKHMFIFYSKFTKNLVEKSGFRKLTELELNGEFPYPTPQYLSFVGHQTFKNNEN